MQIFDKESFLLDTKDAAKILNVKPSTLATWRCTNTVKIPYVKIGRKVLYRESDLSAFIASSVNGGDHV